MTILLVRLRLIGDVVFTTPLIGALRRRHPTATLVYLVETAAAPVVAINEALTEIIVVPRSRGWRRLRDDVRLAAALRARRFDVVIDLHGGPRSAWLTWATRAPVRVGYDVAGRTWMYTRLAPRSRTYQPRHAVENQWDLLTAIDPVFGRPDRVRDRVVMPVDPAAARQTVEHLQRWHVPADGRLVVIHVSAGNPFRRWPESAFAELVAGLAGAGADRWILVTAGPSDRSAASRVIEQARQRAGRAAPRIVDAESLSLAELRAVLDHAALFIGGDSGPLHVAATSDVPIVAIFGPTLAERSAPWRAPAESTIAVDVGPLPCRPCDQRACAPGDFRCLTTLSAAAVSDAAERLLEARP